MDSPIVEVDVGFGPKMRMLSIGDDIVAEMYRAGANAFEPASLALWHCLAINSSYAIDVGAFTGIYALVAANANPAIKVAALEPTKLTFARLCLNIQINAFESGIAPLNIAASDRLADMLINHYDGVYCLGSGSTLMSEGPRPFWYSDVTKTFPLDALPAIAACDKRFTVIELPQSGPDIVKIDVEGYEMAVLSGMVQTIYSAQPIFIIECLSTDALSAVHRYLEQFSYTALLLDDELSRIYENLDAYSAATRNVLFYPRAKQSLIAEARSKSQLG